VLLALLPLPRSAVALAILSMIALGGPLTAYTVPAMSVITDAAEHIGIPLAMATMLLNLAWAVGETVGAPAAAGLSQATTDAVPLLILSAIMVLTLRPVFKARLIAPAPAGAAEAHPDRVAELALKPATNGGEPAQHAPNRDEPAQRAPGRDERAEPVSPGRIPAASR
jgi:hypothetical protein